MAGRRVENPHATPDERARAVRIREAVEGLGTQEEAATKTGVTAQYLRMLMGARVRNPSLLVMLDIACASGLALEWLATGKGPKRKSHNDPDTASVLAAFTQMRLQRAHLQEELERTKAALIAEIQAHTATTKELEQARRQLEETARA